MSDLAQGYSANIVLNAGDSVRISTTGQATVAGVYGAPAGPTTLNATSQTFGPYQVPAKLRLTSVSGTANYASPTQVPVTVDQSSGAVNPPGAVSGAGRTYLMTDSPVGRLKVYDPGTDYTVGGVEENPSHGSNFQLELANIHTAPVTVKVSVAFTDNIANGAAWRNPSTATWYDLTLNGSTSIVLPARLGAERPSKTYTDVLNQQTINRADGVQKPYVMYRIEYASGNPLSVPQNNFYDWATPNAGGAGRRWITLAWSGALYVTNKASATTSPQVYDNIVVPGIRYVSKYPGRVIVKGGDSNTEGLAPSTLMIDGVTYAAQTLSTPTSPITVVNAARHSQVPLTYVECLGDALECNPTHVFFNPASINDITNGVGLTGSTLVRARAAMARFRQLMNPYRGRVAIALGELIPSNYAQRPNGAADQYRRDWNNIELPTNADAYTTVLTGWAAAVTGGVDGNGQDFITPALNGDGVHLAAAGYTLQGTTFIAPWLNRT